MSLSTAIVIDNEPSIVELLSKILELKGLEILGKGYNANDAIRLLNEQKPNNIFLDVSLPDLGGIGALKQIKQISSETNVIMMTEDNSKSMDGLLLNFGATSIIYKPFIMENIDKAIEKIKIFTS